MDRRGLSEEQKLDFISLLRVQQLYLKDNYSIHTISFCANNNKTLLTSTAAAVINGEEAVTASCTFRCTRRHTTGVAVSNDR